MKKMMTAMLSLSLLATATPAMAAKTCKDFKTQQQAQTYYEARKKAGQTG